MRILYFSHSFGAPTTTFIRNETEFFCKKDEIKFICSEFHQGAVKPPYVELIPFNENKIFRKIRWLLWKYDIICSFKNKTYSKNLNSVIDSFKPDLIHCHFAYEGLMLLDNLNDIGSHKIIVHFHGYDATQMVKKKSYVRKLDYYLSKKNIFTISCNQYFIETLAQKLKIKLSNYLVLKYGINVNSLFKPNLIKPESDKVVFSQVSSLVEKKGHEYTLLAYKRFLDSNPNINSILKITGTGGRLSILEALTNELGLKDKVAFLGVLKPEEVAALLNETNVFLHHSITDSNGDMEGIPNAIMEAMAMELPIVSTIHSGIPELVEDGVNGYLVKEKDVEHYAIKMMAALKLGKLPQNRMKILNEYNVISHNNLLNEFYKKCSNS